MILTCPECATSYFVDDARIPPAGRTVKCSSCGSRWTAVKAEADEADAAGAASGAASADPATDAEAPPLADEPIAAAPDPSPEPEPEPALRPRPARPPAPPAAAKREAASTVAIWAAMAVTVVALVAAAVVFRGQVMRLWPASSAAYAGLGLSVEGLGLVIEQVKAEPTFQGGRPVLSVSGAIRNAGDHAADSPPLRISLLNKAGDPVAAKVAQPIDARIPAKGRRHFSITILDPPSTAHGLEVAFDGLEPGVAAPVGPAAPHAGPGVAEPHAAEAAAGPAPLEAQPLPAGTPDALADHHG